jgi:hypothetical protein
MRMSPRRRPTTGTTTTARVSAPVFEPVGMRETADSVACALAEEFEAEAPEFIAPQRYRPGAMRQAKGSAGADRRAAICV